MPCRFTSRGGRLLSRYTPAAYFDACILIDWYITFRDLPSWIGPPPTETITDKNSARHTSKSHCGKIRPAMLQLRSALHKNDNSIFCVASVLALAELSSWVSRKSYLEERVAADPTTIVQSVRIKEVRDQLHKLAVQAKQASLSLEGEQIRAQGANAYPFAMNDVFITEHMDEFIKPQRSVINLSRHWDAVLALAYFQVGLADILHLCLARSLGCKWFITSDQDILLFREQISSDLSLDVVTLTQFMDVIGK